MADVFSIALTGIAAQKQRLAASTSNIANLTTVGAVPSSDSSSAAVSTVYKPLRVDLTTMTQPGDVGGGVRADVYPDEKGYSTIFDPSSAYANSEGLVAAPNIDLVEEFGILTETKISFKANLAVIRTESEMLGELLDTKT